MKRSSMQKRLASSKTRQGSLTSIYLSRKPSDGISVEDPREEPRRKRHSSGKLNSTRGQPSRFFFAKKATSQTRKQVLSQTRKLSTNRFCSPPPRRSPGRRHPARSRSKSIERPKRKIQQLKMPAETVDDFEVGDKVILDGPQTKIAIIRYAGPLQARAGRWYGIELIGEITARGNGTGNAVKYFQCSRGRAAFVKREKILGLHVPEEMNNEWSRKPARQVLPIERRFEPPSPKHQLTRSPRVDEFLKSRVKVDVETSDSDSANAEWDTRSASPSSTISWDDYASEDSFSSSDDGDGIPISARTYYSNLTRRYCAIFIDLSSIQNHSTLERIFDEVAQFFVWRVSVVIVNARGNVSDSDKIVLTFDQLLAPTLTEVCMKFFGDDAEVDELRVWTRLGHLDPTQFMNRAKDTPEAVKDTRRFVRVWPKMMDLTLGGLPPLNRKIDVTLAFEKEPFERSKRVAIKRGKDVINARIGDIIYINRGFAWCPCAVTQISKTDHAMHGRDVCLSYIENGIGDDFWFTLLKKTFQVMWRYE